MRLLVCNGSGLGMCWPTWHMSFQKEHSASIDVLQKNRIEKQLTNINTMLAIHIRKNWLASTKLEPEFTYSTPTDYGCTPQEWWYFQTLLIVFVVSLGKKKEKTCDEKPCWTSATQANWLPHIEPVYFTLYPNTIIICLCIFGLRFIPQS